MPDQVAMDCVQGLVTYGQLPQLIAKLERVIAKHVPSNGKPLVCAVLANERAIYPLAMLSVHMAGHIYLPIDVKTPLKRIRACLEGANVDVVLADADGVGCLAELGTTSGIQVADIDVVDFFSTLREEPSACEALELEEPLQCGDDNPAVILFTSGSTGTPKGVQLSHKGYRNWYEFVRELLEVTPQDRVAFTASPAFDIAIGEILLAFSAGATLCVAELGVLRNPKGLAHWVDTQRISVLQSVPSLLKSVVRYGHEDGTLRSLRILISTGEQLECALVRTFRQAFPGFAGRIINLYGPVEASIQVSYCWADEYADSNSVHVPIGSPFGACGLFLDSVQSDGCGELIIYGVQLALGYLEARTTDEKFFVQELEGSGMRCYRTGDLGYINKAGHIVLVGRIDDQIKLNGYRIELGEIESALLTIGGITEACALTVDAIDTKELHAFVVAANLDMAMIRRQLASILPAYMLPRSINVIDALPINQNGKRDKTTLKVHLATGRRQ